MTNGIGNEYNSNARGPDWMPQGFKDHDPENDGSYEAPDLCDENGAYTKGLMEMPGGEMSVKNYYTTAPTYYSDPEAP